MPEGLIEHFGLSADYLFKTRATDNRLHATIFRICDIPKKACWCPLDPGSRAPVIDVLSADA